MAFELGMFLAAKRFGSGQQKQKIALVFDRRGYRYRAALSDISGQDIAIHGGAPKKAIREIRDWLDSSRRVPNSLPAATISAGGITSFPDSSLRPRRSLNWTHES